MDLFHSIFFRKERVPAPLMGQSHGLMWVLFNGMSFNVHMNFPLLLVSFTWTHYWNVSSSGASLYELMPDPCKLVLNEDMITSHCVEKLKS
jgi:hypothetical protein